MTTWRLIQSGPATAAMNMATDEAIMQFHGQGLVPPTLRLYTWQPAGVSIGYFQALSREIDLDACRQAGFGIVRRPTGGRAVLHDDELTYSVVIAESILPGTVLETYRFLSRGLLEGFRLLDVPADLTNPPSQGRSGGGAVASGASGSGVSGSAACFDAPSWYELTSAGKKIVGSAQTRHGGVILQHGAIILHLDVDKLLTTMRFPSDQVRERVRRTLVAKAGGVDQVAGRRIAPEEMARAISAGFSSGLGVVLEDGALTPEESALADELERTKYNQDSWNLRK